MIMSNLRCFILLKMIMNQIFISKKLLMEKLCFIILAVSQFTFLWKRQVLKVMKAM